MHFLLIIQRHLTMLDAFYYTKGWLWMWDG